MSQQYGYFVILCQLLGPPAIVAVWAGPVLLQGAQSLDNGRAKAYNRIKLIQSTLKIAQRVQTHYT